MTLMLTPSDILRQAQRKYPDFVAAHFRGETFFPLPVRFGQPSPSSSLTQLRHEVDKLWEGSHEFARHGYRVEFEERRMRLHGKQRLPVRVWFESSDDFLRFIGQVDNFQQLRADVADALEAAPEMHSWIREKARTLIANLHPREGRALGLAVDALHRRPKPNCFAREIALHGVSGKFIENNLALIANILRDIGSPAWSEALDVHDQLGLRIAPRMLRLMWLDGKGEDFGLPSSRFSQPRDVENILIVENLRSFLTLPSIPRTLAIFGEGRASQTLSRTTWISATRCFYWGDIDPYGFNILASLRAAFSGMQSVLMDRTSFERFRDFAAPTPIPDFKIINTEVQPDPSWVLLAPLELAAARATLSCAHRIDDVVHAYGIEQEKIPLRESADEIRRILSLGAAP